MVELVEWPEYVGFSGARGAFLNKLDSRDGYMIGDR